METPAFNRSKIYYPVLNDSLEEQLLKRHKLNEDGDKSLLKFETGS